MTLLSFGILIRYNIGFPCFSTFTSLYKLDVFHAKPYRAPEGDNPWTIRVIQLKTAARNYVVIAVVAVDSDEVDSRIITRRACWLMRATDYLPALTFKRLLPGLSGPARPGGVQDDGGLPVRRTDGTATDKTKTVQ